MGAARASGTAFVGGLRQIQREPEIDPRTVEQGPVPLCLLKPTPQPQVVREVPARAETVEPRSGPPRPPRSPAPAVEPPPADHSEEEGGNPRCLACGGRTVKRGKDKNTGGKRYQCASCKKTRGETVRLPKVLIPCPDCGEPSIGWGKTAAGSPIRRCPKCLRSWTPAKAPKGEGSSGGLADRVRTIWACRSAEERREIGRRAAKTRLATQSPEVRKEAAKKRLKTLSPERRREIAGKARAALALQVQRRREEEARG